MFSVFLSRYRNTQESLGELKKAVETLAPTAFLILPNLHLCLYNSVETQYSTIFCFLINKKKSRLSQGKL